MKFDTNLLNTTIDDVFINSKLDKRTVLELKSIYGSCLRRIETVFTGMFHMKGYLIPSNDEKLFAECFPFIYKIISKSKKKEYLNSLSKALRSLRNMSMHSFVGKPDVSLIATVVEGIPNFNNEVKYLVEDKITLAGLTAFLYTLSNDKMITYFAKDNSEFLASIYLIRLINKTYETIQDYSSDIADKFGMRDEIDIRKEQKCECILEAILGKNNKETIKTKKSFIYSNEGVSENDEYYVSGSFENNILTIDQGTFYPNYFFEDYTLKIEDEKEFVELSSKVPPMYFVYFLYKLKIKKFTKDCLTEEQIALLLKYNKPKYYVDKNANTLFIPKEYGDLRMLSQIVTRDLMYCFINLEDSIYGYYKIMRKTYSKLSVALRKCNVSEETIKEIIFLRNFCAHGYVLGDTLINEKKEYRICTLDFALDALDKLVNELKEKDKHYWNLFVGDLTYRVFTKLFIYKYRDVITASEKFYKSLFDRDLASTLLTKNRRIEASIINDEIETKILALTSKMTLHIYDKIVNHLIQTNITIEGVKYSFYTSDNLKFSSDIIGNQKIVEEKRIGFRNIVTYS